jgi:hypothetical protein
VRDWIWQALEAGWLGVAEEREKGVENGPGIALIMLQEDAILEITEHSEHSVCYHDQLLTLFCKKKFLCVCCRPALTLPRFGERKRNESDVFDAYVAVVVCSCDGVATVGAT